MSACTFFGHRDAPSCIRPRLRSAIIHLTENCAVDRFYAGKQGTFDQMVYSVLSELRDAYPHIRFFIVLERLPENGDMQIDHRDTLYPEGMEYAPPRFAIFRRN